MANYYFNSVEVPAYFFNTIEGPINYYFNTIDAPQYFFNTKEEPPTYYFNTIDAPQYFFNTKEAPTEYFFNTKDSPEYFFNTKTTPTEYFFNVEDLFYDIVLRPTPPQEAVSSIEQLRVLARDVVIDRINELLALAYKKERVGEPATCEYFDINAILFVIDFLSFIKFKMNEDQKYEIERTANYYYNLYEIKKLVENYRCLKINVSELVSIFGIKDYQPEQFEYPTIEQATGEGLFSDTYDEVFD